MSTKRRKKIKDDNNDDPTDIYDHNSVYGLEVTHNHRLCFSVGTKNNDNIVGKIKNSLGSNNNNINMMTSGGITKNFLLKFFGLTENRTNNNNPEIIKTNDIENIDIEQTIKPIQDKPAKALISRPTKATACKPAKASTSRPAKATTCKTANKLDKNKIVNEKLNFDKEINKSNNLAPWDNEMSVQLRNILSFPDVDTNFEETYDVCNAKISHIKSYVHNIDNTQLDTFLKERNLQYQNNESLTDDELIKLLQMKRDKKIQKIKTDYDKLGNEDKKGQNINEKIKNINKTHDTNIKLVNKTVKCHKYRIKFTDTQKKILLNWYNICDNFYNYCVDRFNKETRKDDCKNIETNINNVNVKTKVNEQIKTSEKTKEAKTGSKTIFNKDHQIIKKEIFEDYFNNYVKTNKDVKKFGIILDKLNYKNYDDVILSYDHKKERDILKNKPVPYDTLTDILATFCRSLKSNYTKLQKGMITHFEMKRREHDRTYKSICVPKKLINENGIFITFLGEGQIKTRNKKLLELIRNGSIVHDCRLLYDAISGNFDLCVPIYVKNNITKPKNIENLVGCKDEEKPKEKFVALDPGVNIFMAFYGEKTCGKIATDMKGKILRLQSRINKIQGILKKGLNRSGKKMKCKTKLRKKKHKYEMKIKNIVQEIRNKASLYLCKNYENIFLPEFNTSEMLNGDTLTPEIKTVLQKQSHYKFKEHIKAKGEQYGSKVHIVTEEYTSQSCGKCGKLSKVYVERVKQCSTCKSEIDRDMNGSRNILIKNIGLILNR